MGKNMLLSNQNSGFSDDQYISKDADKVLDFLFTNSYQRKIASMTTTVGLG